MIYLNYRLIAKLFFLWLLFAFSVAVISNWRIDYHTLIGFIAYFYFTIFCIHKFRKEATKLTIFCYIILLQIIFHFNSIYGYFGGSLFSLWLFSTQIFAIFSGFVFIKFKNIYRFIPFLIASIFTVFMFFQGYDYWLHKLNYGTFTGKVQAFALPTKFESVDEQKRLINDNNLKDKIVLLDFWYTGCGICFEKFPQLETAYQKYKTDSSVLILAVDKPIEEDKPNEAFEMIKKEGYTFPVVIAKDEEMPEKFGVKGYPTTFVINQNNQIVYKGDIAGAVKMVDELKQNSQ